MRLRRQDGRLVVELAAASMSPGKKMESAALGKKMESAAAHLMQITARLPHILLLRPHVLRSQQR